MADVPHLRVSDQDREQAASEIRDHYAAGRLDSDELEERVQAAYSARTQSELEALSSDLPALPPKPPTTTELVRRAVASNVMARNAGFGVGAFAVCAAIWVLTSAHGDFWPKWVLVLTLVTIVRGGRRGARRGRPISQAGRGISAAGGGAGGEGGDGRDGRDGSRHDYSYRHQYHHGHGHRHEHQHGAGEE